MGYEIYNEDCRAFLDRGIPYDYVLTSPPDFMEIGLKARKDLKEYEEFLISIYEKLNPRLGVVSIICTDKKKDSRIYTKHITNIQLMRKLGWTLISEKLWLRQLTRNDYEMGYTFILTFAKDKPRQSKHPSYMPDVYQIKRETGVRKYKHRHIGLNSFPQELGERCVLNFTEPGEVVCDPFMGIGGTALAALALNRSVVGSELDETTHQLLMGRLNGKPMPLTSEASPPDPNSTVFDIFDIKTMEGS